MAPPAARLMDEIVEKILLRFPPDDPARLLDAALVCKRWCRLVTDGGFRRRFRERHSTPPLLGHIPGTQFSCVSRFAPTSSVSTTHRRSPPLLGFLCNRFHAGSRFVPASSFRPPNADRHGLRAVHSAHGRVLLHHAHAQWDQESRLVVWDPVADEERELPPAPHPSPRSWNAAVLCAAPDDRCDHLDCHRDPFLVVFVGADADKAFSCVYSSETHAWSEPIYAHGSYSFELGNSVLLGSALYFNFKTSMGVLLKYDLLTQELSPIRRAAVQKRRACHAQPVVLMAMEDGRLGFAFCDKATLCLWSREYNPHSATARWALDRVVELDRHTLRIVGTSEAQVAGFADSGAGRVVFVRTGAGFFSIDLKSGKSKKLGESVGFSPLVVPYVSFCTPALHRSRDNEL